LYKLFKDRKNYEYKAKKPHYCGSFFAFEKNYSSTGAPTGQADAQAPQAMQAPASITYAVSPSLIAPTGHSAAQAPQEIQASVILKAMIITSIILRYKAITRF
jgi:hypothetical protein